MSRSHSQAQTERFWRWVEQEFLRVLACWPACSDNGILRCCCRWRGCVKVRKVRLGPLGSITYDKLYQASFTLQEKMQALRERAAVGG